MNRTILRRFFIVIILIGSWQTLLAQITTNDSDFIARQCVLLRELVFVGQQQHFAPIQDKEIGSTRGYRTDESWGFTTTRYDANLRWPGANRNYLEYYTDKTDTSSLVTWQYIAEYTHVLNATTARGIYAYLNRQIEGCSFPLNDSTTINFSPLPDSMLPADRPAMLETASLYNLPVLGLDKNSTIHVMTGMEKRINDYTVCLIIENVVKKPMPKHFLK